ncbi:MAG: DinB family protein [Actinobacteria bacterium]|nr:DinB family protein [Actinomycetota bacterium]
MSDEIIKAYIESGEKFIAVAEAAENSAMNKSAPDGEWNGAFVVHHMGDFELHFSHRVLRMLTEDNPEIVGYSEEPYPGNLNYAARDWRLSLATVRAARLMTSDILKKIDPSMLTRPGMHTERGAITLADILSSAAKHIASHTEQLTTALK